MDKCNTPNHVHPRTLFTLFIHALLEFQNLPSPFLSAQVQTPGVKWCPWLCLIIQSMFPAHECACNSIFSCLYLCMLYLTGHKLKIPIDCPVVIHCDVLWVLNMTVCPGRPSLLFLGFITFRTVTASVLNGISAYIVFFFFLIILQNKWLWPTDAFIYFFRGEVIVRHTASADLRWNEWTWLTLDNSKMYLWQTRRKLKARTKSYLFLNFDSHLIYHCL